MKKEVRYYNWVCKSAQAYRKGLIAQDVFLGEFGNYIMWKLNNTITPYVNNIDLDRGFLNAK